MWPNDFSFERVPAPDFTEFVEQLRAARLPIAEATDRLGMGSWEIILDLQPRIKVFWDGRDRIASILRLTGGVDPTYGHPVHELLWDSSNEDDAEPDRLIPLILALVDENCPPPSP